MMLKERNMRTCTDCGSIIIEELTERVVNEAAIETFTSGAVRCPTGRRYDLMSVYAIELFMNDSAMRDLVIMVLNLDCDKSLQYIVLALKQALDKTDAEILDLYAKALDEGACKYGERNWEKGIPESNLVNHAIAHAIKLQAGDTSENHAAHLVWNVMTIIHFRLQGENNG